MDNDELLMASAYLELGKIEYFKRKIGLTEEDLYGLQVDLKDKEEKRKLAEEIAQESNKTVEEMEEKLEEMCGALKRRRKLFKILKKEAKENEQKEEVSQEIKENGEKTT